MKMKSRRFVAVLSSLLMTASLISGGASLSASAVGTDPVVVVSLGDSYSSGEGITPFYGQDKGVPEKFYDYDWLSHRSKNGWPAQLVIPGVDGVTKDYEYRNPKSDACRWYFGAVSGAETKNFSNEKQEKKVNRKEGGLFGTKYQFTRELPLQMDVFKDNNLQGKVDYVTLSVGGNDVGFSDIVTTCAVGSTYLEDALVDATIGDYVDNPNVIDLKMAWLWANFSETRANIKQVYKDIQDNAGEQAEIIVAGYPQLLEPNGKGVAISQKEAQTVDANVSKFNNKLKELVEECQSEGMHIHFVSVEEEFNKDGGHAAYSSDPWINPIIMTKDAEDLEGGFFGLGASAFSMHPNATGAQHYAKCVNDLIASIHKQGGVLSGKVCKASDHSTPISNASVKVYDGDTLVASTVSDSSGNYSVNLPIGNYHVDINASGYIDFSCYTDVVTEETTYMETFLMVEGEEGETGNVSGTVINGLTGSGVEGVQLTVRKNWNNSQYGDVVATGTTQSNGSYTLENLPIGNYTVSTYKEGFVNNTFNIVVQKGDNASQNGTITPFLSGDSYRIILTWGENPSDLDSHVYGYRSSGTPFHVYFSDMHAYDDNNTEICNLDVDDTTSYGPETITLRPSSDKPYYYYIYKYAGSGTVAASLAKITVYQGENIVGTFNVPTDLGPSDYWNVFAIKNGQLIINNTITSSPNTSYAD